MENTIMNIGRFGLVSTNLSNMDSTSTIEIGIPVKFLNANWKLKAHVIAENIGKHNNWSAVDHSQDEAYISLDLSRDSTFNPNTEITYELFVNAFPMNPDEAKSQDEPAKVTAFIPTLEEKKIFKKILLETITEQIMEG